MMELRKKAQVTIPMELITKLGLKPGDKLEAIEKDGGIFLTPVVVYPKSTIQRIAKLIKEADEDREAGDIKAYENISEAFREMGIEFDEL